MRLNHDISETELIFYRDDFDMHSNKINHGQQNMALTVNVKGQSANAIKIMLAPEILVSLACTPTESTCVILLPCPSMSKVRVIAQMHLDDDISKTVC